MASLAPDMPGICGHQYPFLCPFLTVVMSKQGDTKRNAREVRHTAWVVRRTPYRDADLIIEFFTEEDGLLAAFAAGARKSRKQSGPALLTLARLDILIRRGRGDLWHLREVTPQQVLGSVTQDYASLAAAGAALRLVRAAAREGLAEPGLFNCLCQYLSALDSFAKSKAQSTASAPIKAPQGTPSEDTGPRLESEERRAHGRSIDPMRSLTTAFRARLLGHLGLAPELGRCGSCGRAPRTEQRVSFEPALEALRCRECGGGRLDLGPLERYALRYHLERRGPLVEANTLAPLASAAHELVTTALARNGIGA